MTRAERERRALFADGMTPAQQRRAVLIAQDVLKWLRGKRLVVETDRYLKFADGVPAVDGSLQRALPKLITARKPCQVCALGACFLASIDRFNKIDVSYDVLYGCVTVHQAMLDEHLTSTFSLGQLRMIESAFEQRSSCQMRCELAKPGENEAVEFGYTLSDPRRRLRAIMRNIIENRGVFVPPAIAQEVQDA